MPRKHICIGMVWKLFISTSTVLKYLRIEGKASDSDASVPSRRSLDNVRMYQDAKPIAFWYFFITLPFQCLIRNLKSTTLGEKLLSYISFQIIAQLQASFLFCVEKLVGSVCLGFCHSVLPPIKALIKTAFPL